MKIFRNKKAESNRKSGIHVILIGVLIAYFPNYIHRILNLFDVRIGPEGPPSVIIWNWVAVAVIILYIIIVEKRKLSSILITKPKAEDIKWAWYFWGIAMTWYWLIHLIVPQAPDSGTDTIINLPIPVILGIIFTTAITEEILFRGYPIERIQELTERKWIAVAISFIIFVFPHVQFMGLQWIIYHGIGTVLIYVLYIWRKNLLACMLLHLLLNLPILIPALGLA